MVQVTDTDTQKSNITKRRKELTNYRSPIYTPQLVLLAA